jgi:GNAT superfamily N-acetyltransferase
MQFDADGDKSMLGEQDEDRQWVHTRQIICRGYRRGDGLWQIEASVADEKGQPVPFRSRPEVSAGELIHHLSLDVVIDDDYQIRDIAAKTLAAPWPACTDVAADYRKLIGLRIGPGFNRAVREVLGGSLGCTHLSDLLGQVANTYMQASFPDRLARQHGHAGMTAGDTRMSERQIAGIGASDAHR